MKNSRKEDLAHQEWDLWREMCNELLLSGAVTEDDLNSPTTKNDTRGCMVLNAIRAWGEVKVAMEKAKD